MFIELFYFEVECFLYFEGSFKENSVIVIMSS